VSGGTSLPRLKVVWNYLEWGGANIYLLAIMKQAASSWDVEVLLPSGSSPEMLRMITDTGARYTCFDGALDLSPAPTVKRKLNRQWKRLRSEMNATRALLREGLKGSVVHAELAPWQSWIFYLVLLASGAGVCCTVHNALIATSSWRTAIWKIRLRILSNRKHFQIFVANANARESLRGFVNDRFWQRIPVTYPGVDVKAIKLALQADEGVRSLRLRLGFPKDSVVILSAGRFIERKGCWTLLEAAAEVCMAAPQAQFVWLTPELPSPEMLERISKYGLSDRFRLVRSSEVGSGRPAILRSMRAADIFALPSFIEGLPIAILEAMALGIPPIGTNVFGIPEAIRNGETGILIPPGDPASLASAILRLVADPALRKGLGDAAQQAALVNFDESRTAQIAISEYERLLTLSNREV